MIAPRPRVFVSSTISDLRDLRDALKFWLEEMGFDVQMSEHNDFQRRPGAGTFDACFESIRCSDYYLLVVGSNRGSWYEESERVSITRQEYRVAYESLVAAGKPAILAFVRTAVVTALAERTAAVPLSGSGSTLQDPEFTREFLAEVGRDEETKQAASGLGAYPVSNWLTSFATFRELVDGLRSSLRVHVPLPRAAVLESLRHELEHNLRLMMTKHRGRPFYPHSYLTSLRDSVTLTVPELDSTVTLGHTQIKRALMYVAIGTTPSDKLLRGSLEQAIHSGALLEYDRERNRYVASGLLTALHRLRDAMDRYASVHSRNDEAFRQRWTEAWYLVKDRPRGERGIPGHDLLLAFGLYDRQQDVVRLLVAILRYLHGHTEDVEYRLRSTTPLAEEEQQLAAEEVADHELRAWLLRDDIRLRLGLEDLTDEQKRLDEGLSARLKELLGEHRYEELMQQARDEILGDNNGDITERGRPSE